MNTIPNVPKAEGDDLSKFGYEQPFRRTLRSFTSFAIAVSATSITVGIFATYGFLLNTSGPAGLWMWIIAVLGQLLVALICAQIAAHIPLAGFTYQWASRLASPRIGWGFGWLYYATFAIGIVSVNFAFATQVVVPLFNLSTGTGTAEIITIVAMALQAALLIVSTRIAAMFNAAAVATEILGVVVLGVILLVAVVVGSAGGSLHNLTATGAIPHSGYFKINGPFMLALLLVTYTVAGFEAPSNLSEETQDPTTVVPRAIWRSVVVSGVVGLFFLIALTVAIPSIPAITEDPAPVSAIMSAQLGSTVETIFLAFVLVSFFACGLVIMALCSRVVYAMSRDKRFPAHQLFSRVPTALRTPVWSILLVFVGGTVILLTMIGTPATLTNLFTATSIVLALIYLGTVLLYLGTRSQLPHRSDRFDLGRWSLPIAIAALLWVVFELVALLGPSVFWEPVKLVGVIAAIGAVIFAGFLIFSPDTLSREPGAAIVDDPTAPLPEPEPEETLV